MKTINLKATQLINLLMLIVITISMVFIGASNISIAGNRFINQGFEYEVKEDGNLEIVRYTGNKNNVVILGKYIYKAGFDDSRFRLDETVKTSQIQYVTSIGIGAFQGNIDIVNLEIPANITEIKENAFNRCSCLSNLNIRGSGLTIIRKGAFHECYCLSKIIFPPSLKVIEPNAFTDCENLKEVIFLGPRPKMPGAFPGSGITFYDNNGASTSSTASIKTN